jgi:predicted acetyltransferase
MTGPMDIRVVAAKSSDEETLRNLLQLYAYDFSEILPQDVGETGRFKDSPLDPYWNDTWRFPFLIRADQYLAGFALVHQKSRLSGAVDVWDMAEFFVLRRYRRVGVGMGAAHGLFAMHAGKWEVRQRNANASATVFWRRAISVYTKGRFDEEMLDDERWRGPVQRFTSHDVTSASDPG